MRNLLSVAACVMTAVALVAAQERPDPPAQTPEPIQGPSFRSGVDLVAVDVSVVDRNGRPVDDLLAPDFTVKIDGDVRRVVSADVVKVDVQAARTPQLDKTRQFYTSNMTPPAGRRIVLAIDQVRIGPGTLRPVLEAASRFLDHLNALDQVALVAFPEPGVRVDFTNDKARLRRGLQRVVGHPQRAAPPQRHAIAVTEAIAIVERQDRFVHTDVVERECREGREERENEKCIFDIQLEANEIVRQIREDSDASFRGLRQLLEQLAKVEGPKLMVLLSEGFMASEVDLQSIVTLAGEARTSLNSIVVDLRRADVTNANRQPNAAADRRLQFQSLEGISAMSRGSLFRISGSGDGVFERLASEISAYYILGVEQRPQDSVGDRHRIDVDVRRRDVTIRSRQAFVLSPARLNRRAKEKPDEALQETLASPFSVSGVPVRATTFTQQDAGTGKVRLVVAAQVGEAGAPPGEYAVGYIVLDKENRVAASFKERMTLVPGSGARSDALKFVGGVVVDPGVYSLRLAVIDQEGRRGSIVRDVSAWKMAGEPFAMGDLVVGPVPADGKGIAMEVEPYVATDGVAAFLELYSTTDTTWKGTTVAFEIADTEDGPALTSLDATVAPGRQPAWRVAAGVVPARVLPPGPYVARAKIARDGKAVGVLVRPFVLGERVAGNPAAPAVAATRSAVTTPTALGLPLPKFDPAVALRRDLLDSLLAMVEERSPDLKPAVAEARAGRWDAAARAAFTTGDLIAGAFLDGVDQFAKGEFAEAIPQFQAAAGSRREFFPAAFFEGAAYAAAGRDRDAAGVWQLSLGNQVRPLETYTLSADARLRTGVPQSAVDILKPVYDRDPAQDEIARRLATAYAMANRHAEALTVLDAYLVRRPADQDMLFAAIASQYEAVRAGQALSSVDREKLRKYVASYTGPNRALVDKYLELMK